MPCVLFNIPDGHTKAMATSGSKAKSKEQAKNQASNQVFILLFLSFAGCPQKVILLENSDGIRPRPLVSGFFCKLILFLYSFRVSVHTCVAFSVTKNEAFRK